jgi:hypothetical protein
MDLDMVAVVPLALVGYHALHTLAICLSSVLSSLRRMSRMDIIFASRSTILVRKCTMANPSFVHIRSNLLRS